MLSKIFRNQRSGVPGFVSLGLCVALAPSLMAQTVGMGALTGRVTDPSGAGVANVTVTATNADTSQTRSTTTGTDGTYKLAGLAPGNYRVKFEASGFKSLELPSAAVNATGAAVLDTKLEIADAGNAIPVNKPPPAAQEELPNAPSSSTPPPSLQDLGFPAEQSQGNAREQALLDKRTHMLKIHQRLGLITTIPLIAAMHFPQRGRRQKHQFDRARPARCPGRGDG